MSEKKRRKRDGHDTQREREELHAGEAARHRSASVSRAGQIPDGHDRPDVVPFKRGSEEDRTTRQRGAPR